MKVKIQIHLLYQEMQVFAYIRCKCSGNFRLEQILFDTVFFFLLTVCVYCHLHIMIETEIQQESKSLYHDKCNIYVQNNMHSLCIVSYIISAS